MKSKKESESLEANLLADYCWSIVGSQRKKIIKSFNSEKLPSQIQKETGIRFCNVSRVLRGMVDRGLVECLNIEKRYKLYRLTERGSRVVNKIKIL